MTWSTSGLDGVTVQASIIEHALATAMPNLNTISLMKTKT